MNKRLHLYFLISFSVLFSFCSKQTVQEDDLSLATWTISYFWDQQDRKSDYVSFYFMFNSDGTIMAHQGQKLTIGTWSQNGNVFTIYFQTNELLLRLSKQWQIVEKTNSIIKLKFAEQELHFIRG